MPISVLGMQQDGGDPAKKVLYTLFNVPRHYDALQFYDQKLNRYSSEKDIEKSFRQVSRKYHPDKGHSTAECQKFNEIFSIFKQNVVAAAGDAQTVKAVNKEEYDMYLGFIDAYALTIKAAALSLVLYGCLVGYRWYRQNGASSPKSLLYNLERSQRGMVEKLLTIRFDRYVETAQNFSLKKYIPLLHGHLSPQLAERFSDTILQSDLVLNKAYDAIAWQYYDCQSVEELKQRAPALVEELLTCQQKLEVIIEESRKELGIESFYTSGKRLIKPAAAILLFLGAGAGWIRYKQSQIIPFGGFIKPMPVFNAI